MSSLLIHVDNIIVLVFPILSATSTLVFIDG